MSLFKLTYLYCTYIVNICGNLICLVFYEKWANVHTRIQENEISSLKAIIAKQNKMLAMKNDKIDHNQYITSKMKN